LVDIENGDAAEANFIQIFAGSGLPDWRPRGLGHKPLEGVGGAIMLSRKIVVPVAPSGVMTLGLIA